MEIKKLTKYKIGVWSKGLTDQVGIAYLNFKSMYKHHGRYPNDVKFYNFILEYIQSQNFELKIIKMLSLKD